VAVRPVAAASPERRSSCVCSNCFTHGSTLRMATQRTYSATTPHRARQRWLLRRLSCTGSSPQVSERILSPPTRLHHIRSLTRLVRPPSVAVRLTFLLCTCCLHARYHYHTVSRSQSRTRQTRLPCSFSRTVAPSQVLPPTRMVGPRQQRLCSLRSRTQQLAEACTQIAGRECSECRGSTVAASSSNSSYSSSSLVELVGVGVMPHHHLPSTPVGV
jgi:hypothetical protein